jgi:proteasome lid subunit RPN8/RPN11
LLEEEARRVHPVEACGILFGKLNHAEAVVEKVVIAPNILRSGERFEINPETVVKAILESEKKGLYFIGLFHSHPAPANPSLVDIEFMKLWGDAIWLILSLTDGKLAAFQMKDGLLEEVAIELNKSILPC